MLVVSYVSLSALWISQEEASIVQQNIEPIGGPYPRSLEASALVCPVL